MNNGCTSTSAFHAKRKHGISRWSLRGTSESTSLVGDPAVPRDVAYAVAEVSWMLRALSERTGSPAGHDAARQVDAAWLAVLAGDIDDIAQHVRDEEAAK